MGNGINLGTVFIDGEAEGVLGSVMGVFKPKTYLDLGWRAGATGKSSVEILSDGTPHFFKCEETPSGTINVILSSRKC